MGGRGESGAPGAIVSPIAFKRRDYILVLHRITNANTLSLLEVISNPTKLGKMRPESYINRCLYTYDCTYNRTLGNISLLELAIDWRGLNLHESNWICVSRLLFSFKSLLITDYMHAKSDNAPIRYSSGDTKQHRQ